MVVGAQSARCPSCCRSCTPAYARARCGGSTGTSSLGRVSGIASSDAGRECAGHGSQVCQCCVEPRTCICTRACSCSRIGASLDKACTTCSRRIRCTYCSIASADTAGAHGTFDNGCCAFQPIRASVTGDDQARFYRSCCDASRCIRAA